MKVVAFLLLSNTFIFAYSQTARAIKYETQLRDTIFKDYDIRSRPVEYYHLAVSVNFSISLHQILKVDEKNQVITTNIWRSLIWKDAFLKWNPENYGNITQVLKSLILHNYFLIISLDVHASWSNLGTRYTTLQFGIVRNAQCES